MASYPNSDTANQNLMRMGPPHPAKTKIFGTAEDAPKLAQGLTGYTTLYPGYIGISGLEKGYYTDYRFRVVTYFLWKYFCTSNI